MTNNDNVSIFDPLKNLTIADEHLRDVLQGRAFLVQDGAMGTMIQASGVTVPGPCPDVINLTHPELVTAIHRQYVDAGAEMVTSNTFNTNRKKLEGAYTVEEIYAAAEKNARAAGARYVAGDIGPTGSLLAPMGTMSFDEAYDIFAEQAIAAKKAGCDLIAIETMSDLLEAKAAVLASRENTDLPIFVTMTFEEDGRTFLGTPPEVAAIVLSGLGVCAMGVNCSLGPAEMLPIVTKIAEHSRVPLVVRPNAGLPRIENDKTIYDITPKEFGDALEDIIAKGANILGGCCGTNPDFIREITERVAKVGMPLKRPYLEGAFTIASATQPFILRKDSPSIGVIGERINPTGKPKLKAALRDNNLDYLIGEAASQQAFGADILDVNVGLPEIDEPSVLEATVAKLSNSCTLPLVIDSSDPVAIERAIRSYPGKPLINSVNGKRESLDSILPIAAKYGCAVIGLTLDENGIPCTAEERYAIGEHIVREAALYGIPACDIVIDCLTMAVATNQQEAHELLCAIHMVKERLGCRTTLGVSNISFGLPQRPLMNSTFLATALGAGLDLPILNPNDARYRDIVSCYRVLNAEDEGARAYIERCASTPDPYERKATLLTDEAQAKITQDVKLILEAAGQLDTNAAVSQDLETSTHSLASHASALPIPERLEASADLVSQAQALILSGRKEPLVEVTHKLLAKHDALDIIDGLFIPALDEVGLRFDDGRFFLPQLMASAEAVKGGFDVVKEHAAKSGSQDAATGTTDRPVIIATVKGDIHDIGKNIVKMLLENYGFRVVDLGRDVAPETIVESAREQDIKLVGLSALMTTTCKAMEQTIKLLRDQLPDVKTFVGGAVVTPEYAESIGATYYAKDAAASVKVAEEFYAR